MQARYYSSISENDVCENKQNFLIHKNETYKNICLKDMQLGLLFLIWTEIKAIHTNHRHMILKISLNILSCEIIRKG